MAILRVSIANRPVRVTTRPGRRTWRSKRRYVANVVGIFPNEDAILRLVGAVLMEQHNDWAACDRRYLRLETPPDIGGHPGASLASPKALASSGSAGTAR